MRLFDHFPDVHLVFSVEFGNSVDPIFNIADLGFGFSN